MLKEAREKHQVNVKAGNGATTSTYYTDFGEQSEKGERIFDSGKTKLIHTHIHTNTKTHTYVYIYIIFFSISSYQNGVVVTP